MTPQGFRRLALSLPEVHESSHMRHPDFRVGRKVFATLGYPDAKWGMIKLTPKQQKLFVAAEPKVFVPVKGAWGKGGATNVSLRQAAAKSLRPAMEEAWRNIAPAKLLEGSSEAKR